MSHLQQLEDQRHAHELAVERLAEVARARVAVYGGVDLVHARQRVEYGEVALGAGELVRREDVAVLQPEVVLLVEEARCTRVMYSTSSSPSTSARSLASVNSQPLLASTSCLT